MPTFSVDGSSLRYTVMGEGDRLPLLCLHGGGCRGSDFAALAERIGSDRKLICPDLRGHGDSPADGDAFDPPRFADDAAALLDELGIDQFIVVGHSLGGPIALELLKRGKAVAAIIAIDAPLVLAEGMAAGMQQLVGAYEAGQGDAAYRQFMDAVAGYADDAAAHDALLENLCSVSANVIEPLIRAVIAYDGTEALGASSIPVLHIDAGFGVCDLERLSELRPDAWIGKTVGTGHYPHIESPDQVSSMVEHFLARHSL